jgi:hypothetical protein
MPAAWDDSCERGGHMGWEILVGRSLAFGLHPLAAWPRLSTSARALLIAAYCGAGYAIVLTALLLLNG